MERVLMKLEYLHCIELVHQTISVLFEIPPFYTVSFVLFSLEARQWLWDNWVLERYAQPDDALLVTKVSRKASVFLKKTETGEIILSTNPSYKRKYGINDCF